MSLVTQLSNGYAYSLAHHYYPTQSVTFSAFSTAGDALAQHRRNVKSTTTTKQAFDWKRNRQFMLKGLGCGIIWAFWYQWADHTSQVMARYILTTYKLKLAESILRTLSSMVLEQCIAAPLIYSLWDLPILCLLKGIHFRAIPGVVRKKLPSFLVAHFKLWTLVNMLIYSIPMEWRVFSQSVFDVLWESIASTIASDEHHDGSNEDGGGGGVIDADEVDLDADKRNVE